MRSSNNEKRLGIITRTAKEVRQYRLTMRLLTALLCCIAALVGVIYVCAAMYENTGSFTVSLNKADMTECGLSLSETEDLRYKTSNLNANIATSMTNIDGKDIPENVDTAVDGEHNGNNYIAYTFYLTNAGKNTVSYEYTLNVSNATKGLDDAIRVKLFVNGEGTTYAKKSKNDIPEEGTVAFNSSNEITRMRADGFKPGDRTKYTVVIWIEGNDPECVDFVIGGEVKLDMDIKVVE